MRQAFLLAAILVGCAGSDSGLSGRSVAITSHGHDEEVVGTIVLNGTASGGDVTVMIDDQSFAAAMDGEGWSLEVDTTQWPRGWHTVQAQVGAGLDLVTALLNLYFADGRIGDTPDLEEPPVVVRPVPPTAPEIPQEGLAAHWTFNSGNAIDSSGNGHHGMVYGPTLSEGALVFDGVDDMVRIPNENSPAPSAIADLTTGTISVRFRYDDILNGAENADTLPLLYLGSDESASATAGSDSVSIYIAHGALMDPNFRQVYFTVLEKGKVTLCFDTTVTLVQGRTYTYTVSIAPGSHKAYLDGVEVERHYNADTSLADDHFFASVAAPDMLAFGYHHFGLTQRWWHHNGRIDDILIYDRALTASEISVLASTP